MARNPNEPWPPLPLPTPSATCKPRPAPSPPGLSEPGQDEPPWLPGCDNLHRLIYQLEARLNVHYEEAERERVVAETAEKSRRRDTIEARAARTAVRATLATQASRLNLLTAGLVSVALFALAGPEGLRQVVVAIEGGDLEFDAVVTIAGVLIPLLFSVGHCIFLTGKPPRPAADDPEVKP